MSPTCSNQPPDLLTTSREVTQEPVDEPVDEPAENLPGTSREPGYRDTLTGQPPDLLTSLPNGRSDRRCPGGLEPPDPAIQQVQEVTLLNSVQQNSTTPHQERNTQ